MRRMSERLHQHLISWDGTVSPARPAATVVVLRESQGELEVFLMQRHSSMAFAANMLVFPGGAVQASDHEPETPWIGPSIQAWASAFGCTPVDAQAHIVAAVRETFEETGILLAGEGDSHVVTGAEADLVRGARRQLEHGELSMRDFLRNGGLAVRSDLLAPWAHWITPEFEPRRFDTRFFLAMAPEGQVVRTLATEAAWGGWFRVREAHAEGKAGRLPMMPPTIHTLGQILMYGADDLLARAWLRRVETIAPRAVAIDGQFWLDGPSEKDL